MGKLYKYSQLQQLLTSAIVGFALVAFALVGRIGGDDYLKQSVLYKYKHKYKHKYKKEGFALVGMIGSGDYLKQ